MIITSQGLGLSEAVVSLGCGSDGIFVELVDPNSKDERIKFVGKLCMTIFVLIKS